MSPDSVIGLVIEFFFNSSWNEIFELYVNSRFQIRLEGLKHQVKISVIALLVKRGGQMIFRSSNLVFYLFF